MKVRSFPQKEDKKSEHDVKEADNKTEVSNSQMIEMIQQQMEKNSSEETPSNKRSQNLLITLLKHRGNYGKI